MKFAKPALFRTRSAKVLTSMGAALALCFPLTFLLSCTQDDSSNTSTRNNSIHEMIETTMIPESYEDVYKVIQSSLESRNQEMISTFAERDMVIENTSSKSPSDGSAEIPPSSAGDYSETNVQVSGIDEGDIVKNNDGYIFIASGQSIAIAKAEGADTEEIARVSLDFKTLGKEEGEQENPYINFNEIYVYDNTLIALYEYSPNSITPSDSSAKKLPESVYRTVSELALFDISDPVNPRFVESFGQDGTFTSSRLNDGIVYVTSRYYVNSEISEDEPATFVPLIYTRETAQMLVTPNICIVPDLSMTTYTVISSIDVNKAQRIDSQSILGSGGSIYMSSNNLYLSGSSLTSTEINSYQDGSFTVKELSDSYDTRITKLSLNEGTIEYVADTVVQGSILNQFSLDEYDDHLRLVTTIERSDYRVITDSDTEIPDYDSYEYAPSTNSLFILDANLNQVGSITDLAEDERIYSARFDKEVGYFVTFRQVDPLFALDLSDPKNPTIKSELKIPGFSNYLHMYSENRLIGLGMAADDSGVTQGLKLSMFDTSDPYNVSEKHVLNFEELSSEALYNHKAIIVSPEHDLIGFPVEEGYNVYGYSDEQGFYQRAKLKQSDVDTVYPIRGLYINDYFYLASANNITSYDLETLQALVASITLEVEEPAYGIVEPYAVR